VVYIIITVLPSKFPTYTVIKLWNFLIMCVILRNRPIYQKFYTEIFLSVEFRRRTRLQLFGL